MRRLSVKTAATDSACSRTTITNAMDLWISSRGQRGLRHVEEESIETVAGEVRQQRWTTARWIEQWQDQLADEMIGRRPKAKRITKLETDENGLLKGSTRDILKAQGFYK